MSERNDLAKRFYIDDHAVVYGLLLKQAEALCGEAGEKASEKGTILYGRERGLRMAMRCSNDGQPLTPRNYLNYSEWTDERQWSEFVAADIRPFVMHAKKCGWQDSWKKYGLEKYGKVYCRLIDKELVRGFNPENVLIIDGSLSLQDEKCCFTFPGADYADEDDFTRELALRADLRKRTIMDFLYHTGHILSALRRTYQLELGLPKGMAITGAALQAYADIFGEDKRTALVAESHRDYSTI